MTRLLPVWRASARCWAIACGVVAAAGAIMDLRLPRMGWRFAVTTLPVRESLRNPGNAVPRLEASVSDMDRVCMEEGTCG